MRQTPMRRFISPKYAAVTAAVAGVLGGGAYVLPAAAQAPPPPIAFEFLTARSVFVDDISLKFKIKLDGRATHVVDVKDPSLTVVVRITLQPGAQFPWHTHVGPVVVSIVSGALTYVGAEDCVLRTYAAGQAFVDPGQGHVHTAFNPTNAETVLVATFFDAPAEGPLLIPAAPGGC
jgi:quercetin dioxygenase-like cupin family protein